MVRTVDGCCKKDAAIKSRAVSIWADPECIYVRCEQVLEVT